MPASQTTVADLFEVCAAADGVVEGISKVKNAPVVLRHTNGTTQFITVYQHLDLTACPLNVGVAVRRVSWPDSRTKMRRPILRTYTPDTCISWAPCEVLEFTHASGDSERGWKSSVCHRRLRRLRLLQEPNQPARPTTTCRTVRPDCFTHRIQGATHPIQWAAQPLVDTLPVSQQTGYLKIVRMQFRCRRSETRGGVPSGSQPVSRLAGGHRQPFLCALRLAQKRPYCGAEDGRLSHSASI